MCNNEGGPTELSANVCDVVEERETKKANTKKYILCGFGLSRTQFNDRAHYICVPLMKERDNTNRGQNTVGTDTGIICPSCL